MPGRPRPATISSGRVWLVFHVCTEYRTALSTYGKTTGESHSSSRIHTWGVWDWDSGVAGLRSVLCMASTWSPLGGCLGPSRNTPKCPALDEIDATMRRCVQLNVQQRHSPRQPHLRSLNPYPLQPTICPLTAFAMSQDVPGSDYCATCPPSHQLMEPPPSPHSPLSLPHLLYIRATLLNCRARGHRA